MLSRFPGKSQGKLQGEASLPLLRLFVGELLDIPVGEEGIVIPVVAVIHIYIMAGSGGRRQGKVCCRWGRFRFLRLRFFRLRFFRLRFFRLRLLRFGLLRFGGQRAAGQGSGGFGGRRGGLRMIEQRRQCLGLLLLRQSRCGGGCRFRFWFWLRFWFRLRSGKNRFHGFL